MSSALLVGQSSRSASAAEAPAPAESAGAAAGSPPVQPLPKFVEAALARPDRADLKRFDELFEQLVADDLNTRREARRRVAQADPSWLPALAERFEQLSDATNKGALKALLERVREATRAEIVSSGKAAGKSGPVTTPDYLDMLVEYRDRSPRDLVPLTHVVACSRMLEAIGTLPAARRVVSVYVRFGEFLRVDTQLALGRMQDRAIAALVEASGHPVPRIASWATKQLESMGKAKPSEAVQVLDPTLRADVLRAYGKIHDIESARLLISYAESERAQVRLAARQAITLLGEPAEWPVRDAYEKTVGTRAAREWPWDRVARELFAEFDRQRLAEIYSVFRQGQKAAEQGDLGVASAAFDRVLEWDPLFEAGPLLAPTYFAFAESLADKDAHAAEIALRRVERLASDGALRDRAASLRQTLEARELLERGLVDEVLMRRAHELDPRNERIVGLLEEVARNSEGGGTEWRRYLAAGVILVLTAAGLVAMAIRQRQAPAG